MPDIIEKIGVEAEIEKDEQGEVHHLLPFGDRLCKEIERNQDQYNRAAIHVGQDILPAATDRGCYAGKMIGKKIENGKIRGIFFREGTGGSGASLQNKIGGEQGKSRKSGG